MPNIDAIRLKASQRAARKALAESLRKERRSGRRGQSPFAQYLWMDTGIETIARFLKIDFNRIVAESPDTAHIVELGCGDGKAAKGLRARFPDRERVRISAVSLNKSPEWTDRRVDWIVSPFHRLEEKLEKGSVSAFYSWYGLENSPDLRRDSGVIRSLLKPGGLLVTTFPCYEETRRGEYRAVIPEEYLDRMPGFELEGLHIVKRKGAELDDHWVLRLKKAPGQPR